MEAIRVVLKKPEFTNDGARARAVQAAGKSLLDASNAVKLEDFSKYLLETLHSNLKSVGKCRSNAVKRERLWKSFHRQSMDILPQIWEKLHIEVGKGKEQMLSQTINSVLFEDILKEYFAVSPSKMSTNSEDVQFTKDELNALRYASGYVPIVLLKAFERIKDRKQKLEEFKDLPR